MTRSFFVLTLGLSWLAGAGARLDAVEANAVTLSDAAVTLTWVKSEKGWALSKAVAKESGREHGLGTASGLYTVLFSATTPETQSPPIAWAGGTDPFPEPQYRFTTPTWREATTPVALNRAGETRDFFPTEAVRSSEGGWRFSAATDVADITADWRLDPRYAGDVEVVLTLKAKQAGYFSLATPTLATVAPADLTWTAVPGYFQGRKLNPDLVLALAYGDGVPSEPVLVRERAASTLSPLVSSRSGATFAVVPEPGTAQDPWAKDKESRGIWRLGLSHLNRAGALSPTLYHPVLGQDGSKLAAGESLTFRFRYVVRTGDWLPIVAHTARDIYRLDDFLAMKRPVRSLSERLMALHRYVTDDQTSLWRTERFEGETIGAQAYNGAVVGSDKDAMKNSDYGAMWMLGQLTNDPRLTRDRLPFARAFKLVQQQRQAGFFQGAAVGQYYLSKSQRFTEEWGDYVEPVALTYYSMLDLGNILLFSPNDQELRERLRLGAERLLAWQQPDGHWEVAYDRATEKILFKDLVDVRPTFYGLLVAYRVLGDKKYLDAARRGADWLIKRAVDEGSFLGVCGDNRFAPDFATAQIAQGLLDLFDVTHEARYREAAIATARIYATSVYTHPLATTQIKRVNQVDRADWEINQTGLGFEHGGAIGSANRGGPILLESHAGLFVRMTAITGDRLFADLARAGAWAREAFVDPATSVASYYWSRMNAGAGPYPHHAWWQIGWITDYLLAEAEVRSGGAISFPRGFFTPKVGPHASFGFAPGKVLGVEADLAWADLKTGSPAIDYVVARAKDGRVFVVLLNNSAHAAKLDFVPDAGVLSGGRVTKWSAITMRDPASAASPAAVGSGSLTTLVPAAGIAVVTLTP